MAKTKLSSSMLDWLAGLLEGEGCFCLTQGSKKPVIKLSMTDRDVVEKAARWMGGCSVRSYRRPSWKPSRKTMHCTERHGPQAIALMKALLPRMGERRSAKIEELLRENDG